MSIATPCPIQVLEKWMTSRVRRKLPMTLVVVTATSWMLPALHHTSSSSSNSELKIHHCHHVIAIAGVNVNRDKSGNFLLRRRRRWVLRNNPPNSNPTVEAEAEAPHMALDTASNVVRKFYDGINGRNLAAVEDLIADDCIYEDLVFPRPFVGRKAILEFFQKFVDSISADLQFVIDDISDEDTTAVGVTWHLELRGKPFPFSKGCSFYRCEVLNGQRKISYGRDIVEPATKPGDMALVAIRGVTWLLQQFPQLADWL